MDSVKKAQIITGFFGGVAGLGVLWMLYGGCFPPRPSLGSDSWRPHGLIKTPRGLIKILGGPEEFDQGSGGAAAGLRVLIRRIEGRGRGGKHPPEGGCVEAIVNEKVENCRNFRQ